MTPAQKIAARPEMKIPYTVEQLKAAGGPWKERLTFGQRLRIARRSSGLSINEAASLLKRSPRLWKHWEADERIPPAEAEVLTQERLLSTMARAEQIQKSNG